MLESTAGSMLILGVILAASLVTDSVARRTGLPRISLLVLVGVGLAALQQFWLDGAAGLPLGELREPLITLALVMVAFLLGGEFTLDRLRSFGRPVLVLSLTVAIIGGVLVSLGLLVLGFPLAVAVSLGAISAATDPAAVVTAIREARDESSLGHILSGIVAIDDVWGIVLFGISLALLGWLTEAGGGVALGHAVHELGGSIALGLAIGLPAAWLTGRLQPGEPTRTEAFAVILLIAGLAELLGVSPLLTAVTAGCLVANVSRHHERSFGEIEWIEWPFLVFFFVLAGASIDIRALPSIFAVVVAYIVLRLVGRYLGGRLGVALLRRERGMLTPHVGLALTP